MIRRAYTAIFALLAILALTSCAGDSGGETPSPRPLTTDEAEHLALMRFRNFDAGARPVSFQVTDRGVTYVVEATVDFPAGLGYGLVSDAAGTETLLIGWSATTVSTRPWAASQAPLPAPAPDESWTTSAISVQQSRLHATLALVLGLSADRPDNALLLQQTDARWLRDDVVTGDADPVEVSVIAGPTADVVYDSASGLPGDGSAATVRYWIDELGLVHRLELRLGAGSEWTVIDLGGSSGTGIADELGELAGMLGTP